MNIAIATCKTLPEPDFDQQPLLDALSKAEIQAEMLPWDVPLKEDDLATFDACILRSTWNYYKDLEAFLSWVDKVSEAVPLYNPRSVVGWNTRKTYLQDLAQRGFSTVPTAWLKRGQRPDLPAILGHLGGQDLVIKPTVSAASFGTRRFLCCEHNEAITFLTEQARVRDMMIQTYMPSVEDPGEKALVWIDGELTHAVRKAPRFSDQDESISDACPITNRERDLALSVLTPLHEEHDLLYGRVDLVNDGKGFPCIAELELVEPSLFFVQYPPALDRFVQSIRRKLDS